MKQHTLGFTIECAHRQTWAWEVRWTNDLNGFAEAGRCYARCNSKQDAEKIAASLNQDRAKPDLLAALENLTIWHDATHPEHEAMLESEAEHAAANEEFPSSTVIGQRLLSEARAAIAKAKGET